MWRKNLRELAGRPLIAYAIGAARGSRFLERLIVSTDDQEIAAVARSYGADVPFLRPPELARDDSSEWLAWRHAILTLERDGKKPDILVSVPPTAPLRTTADIDACVKGLLEGRADAAIMITPASHNPFFNMVTLNQGMVALPSRPSHPIHRRQDAPPVFNITTVAYAVWSDYVLSAPSLLSGAVTGIVVPRERALDIDTEMDLVFAEFLLGVCRSEQ